MVHGNLLLVLLRCHREELFNYPLQWQKLEEKQILSHTMKVWVVKKVVEYLGASTCAAVTATAPTADVMRCS